MAAAVASYSTGQWLNSPPISITAPTGIQVGDLLIIHVASLANTATQNSIPTGFTAFSNGVTTGGESSRLFYKIADSGDVSAGSYSCTNTASEVMGGSMLRITGVDTSDFSAFAGQYKGTSGSVTFDTLDITPPAANSLILFFIYTLGTTSQGSSHAIVTSNPTWTTTYSPSTTTGQDHVVSCAYAIRPEITSTGDFSVNTGSGLSSIGFSLALKPAITSIPHRAYLKQQAVKRASFY